MLQPCVGHLYFQEQEREDNMKISAESHNVINNCLKEALKKYQVSSECSTVTDIHLQPHADSGELVIFDDDDQELARTIVAEWVDYADDDFYGQVEATLVCALGAMKEKGWLDNLSLLKPYSFVLVDDDKETVADLLLVDDEDTLLLSEELLKGLDEELDTFLKELLEK